MKRFVDGFETELAENGADIQPLADRLHVRSIAGSASAVSIRSGGAVLVSFRGRQYRVERKSAASRRRSASVETGEIFAPMPGQIVDVLVEEGQAVTHRQKILVLEAMKTQQAFAAPFDGVVAKVAAAAGAQVKEGDLLAVIEPSDPRK